MGDFKDELAKLSGTTKEEQEARAKSEQEKERAAAAEERAHEHLARAPRYAGAEPMTLVEDVDPYDEGGVAEIVEARGTLLG